MTSSRSFEETIKRVAETFVRLRHASFVQRDLTEDDLMGKVGSGDYDRRMELYAWNGGRRSEAPKNPAQARRPRLPWWRWCTVVLRDPDWKTAR